jgi:hypothetical protein
MNVNELVGFRKTKPATQILKRNGERRSQQNLVIGGFCWGWLSIYGCELLGVAVDY